VIFSRIAWPLWIFLGFYLWLLLHLIFFSTSYDEQLHELLHGWMRCLLATPLGLSLGLLLAHPQPLAHLNAQTKTLALSATNTSTLLLLISFSGVTLISFSHYIIQVWHSHQLLDQEMIYQLLLSLYGQAKQPFVVGTTLALPLCLILIIRAINQQISKWWILASVLSITLGLFALYFSNTKNGIAIFALSLAVFAVNLALKIHWRLRNFLKAALISVVIISPSYVVIEKHLERNSAWANLVANFYVGIDIDHHNEWKDSKLYPNYLKNQYGSSVNFSTYERTAWFRVGLRLLQENPLGYGLLNQSFGSLAAIKYSDFSKPVGTTRGATHSGWLDFALGMGTPGLLLVLVPLFAAWYRSLYQNGLWFSYASWTIPILSFAYLTTEVSVSHYIELLFFMTAFFCGLTLRFPKPKHRLRTTISE
jgi:hypothetical protein